MSKFNMALATMAIAAAACATVPPAPVVLDTTLPSVIEAGALRVQWRLMPGSEAEAIFGGQVGGQLRFLELSVENLAPAPLTLERKWIRLLAPDGQDAYPLSPFNVANVARPGSGMISTGSPGADALQLIAGLRKLLENRDFSRRWDDRMPEVFRVGAGEARRMLLAFPRPHWMPGLWRLELPFAAEGGTLEPSLSLPLTFKTLERPPQAR
jgi:hypothetical protein